MEFLWTLSPLFFLGLPGLVGGVLVGRWRKSWKAVVVLVALGFLVALGGLATTPDDPDDDDPGLALAFGTFVNLVTWVVGLSAATALARRRQSAGDEGGS